MNILSSGIHKQWKPENLIENVELNTCMHH